MEKGESFLLTRLNESGYGKRIWQGAESARNSPVKTSKEPLSRKQLLDSIEFIKEQIQSMIEEPKLLPYLHCSANAQEIHNPPDDTYRKTTKLKPIQRAKLPQSLGKPKVWSVPIHTQNRLGPGTYNVLNVERTVSTFFPLSERFYGTKDQAKGINHTRSISLEEKMQRKCIEARHLDLAQFLPDVQAERIRFFSEKKCEMIRNCQERKKTQLFTKKEKLEHSLNEKFSKYEWRQRRYEMNFISVGWIVMFSMAGMCSVMDKKRIIKIGLKKRVTQNMAVFTQSSLCIGKILVNLKRIRVKLLQRVCDM